MVTIDSIYSSLEKACKSPQVLLKPTSPINSPFIEQLFADHLKNQRWIKLIDAKVSNEGNFVGLTANARSLFAFPDVPMKGEFTIDESGNVHMCLTITLPDEWKFSASFPFLQRTLIDDLVIFEPKLVISSIEIPQRNIIKGLSFSSKLLTEGPIEDCRWLLNSVKSLEISGPIDLVGEEMLPSVELKATSIPKTSIGFLTLPVQLTMFTKPDKSGEVLSAFIKLDSKIPFGSNFLNISTSFASYYGMLELKTAKNLNEKVSSSFEELKKIWGDQGNLVKAALPKFFASLDSFNLYQLNLTVGALDGAISSAAMHGLSSSRRKEAKYYDSKIKQYSTDTIRRKTVSGDGLISIAAVFSSPKDWPLLLNLILTDVLINCTVMSPMKDKTVVVTATGKLKLLTADNSTVLIDLVGVSPKYEFSGFVNTTANVSISSILDAWNFSSGSKEFSGIAAQDVAFHKLTDSDGSCLIHVSSPVTLDGVEFKTCELNISKDNAIASDSSLKIVLNRGSSWKKQ